MKTESKIIVTCDLCKKQIEKPTLNIRMSARTNEPDTQVIPSSTDDTQVIPSSTDIDICETCFTGLGLKRGEIEQPEILQLLSQLIEEAIEEGVETNLDIERSLR